MVSLNKLINLGLLSAVIGGFYYFGGASGIGQKIGGGVSQFGSSLISALGGIIPKTAGIDGKSSIQEIVERLDLENVVTEIPTETRLATEKEKGFLTLAGFIQEENLGGTINLQTGVFTNAVTTQPLDFTVKDGMVRTGTAGLGEATLVAQAELSKKYGIPTFDVTGAISTFGGIMSGGHISPNPLRRTSGGGISGGASGVTGGGSTAPSSAPSSSPSSAPSSSPSSAPSSSPSSGGGISGGASGVTGGSQPSSRRGTYSGGRRF